MGFLTFDWTTEAKAKLTELWHSGVVTREIGVALGCGKNAVIGKAARMGLPPRSPVKAVRVAKQKIARASPKPIRAFPVFNREPHVEREAELAIGGILLAGLTGHTCRWPLWTGGVKPDPYEARYCGATPVPGKAYCERHRLRGLDQSKMRSM